MKLPWRTPADRSSAEAKDPGPEAGPRVELHRSPGLQAVVGDCGSKTPCAVLDLGPALPENIEFLSARASNIQVVDVFRQGGDPHGAVRLLRKLDSTRHGFFDLVLFWDILDYFSADTAPDVIQAIVPLCAPTARCLVMASATDTVPATVRKYRIVDSSHLRYEWTSFEEKGITQLAPATLGKILSGFGVEHAFVLRNGLREFVAVRNPEA